jgi:DNA polymerase I-like protein with 3'-5' exonuclease and polymerase domains/phage/plasmid primase-like uncharacterized protein
VAFIISDFSNIPHEDTQDNVLAFTKALQDAGFDLVEPVIADGEIHRCHVNDDKPESLNGWYAFHGRFGWYGSWKDPEKQWHCWTAEPESGLSDRDKTALQTAQNRLQADWTDREHKHVNARIRANRLWDSANEDASHPYLVAKRLTHAYGTRVYKDLLLVPMRDLEGTLHTLIRIWPDGTKRLLDGGDPKGHFHTLGTPTRPTYLTEGLATAASLQEATGHCVLCCGDAGNLMAVANALKAEYPEHEFVVAGDNDHDTPGNPGATAAKQAAEILACDFVLPDFTGLDSNAKDTDFNDLARLAGLEVVKSQLENNRNTPDAKVIKELLKLSSLDYDRVREDKAKELGCRTSTLDQLVQRAREASQSALVNGNEMENGGGQTLLLEELEPWPDPVDGAELLSHLRDVFIRFVVLPEGGSVAVTLWTLHTYCLDAAYASPILGITSPERRCGKTTLQSLLAALTYRPLSTSNISPAAVFRSIERWHPTLLIDEADTFLRSNEELRGVVNSGHTRSTAFVIRVEGEENEPRRFSTWAAKAIALIGGLPGTLHDRAIVIPMRRKLPGESVEKLREDKLDFTSLRSQAQRWAQDHKAALKVREPELPTWLNDRAADNWRPLLAIADFAGGDWPTIARDAVKLLNGSDDDHEEGRVKLLADIRDIFTNRKIDRISSADLVAALVNLEDRPWPEWKHGKPLSQNQLARLLRPFKVKPSQLKTFNCKGYILDSFRDAFSRYLPPLPPFQTETPKPCRSDGHFHDFQTETCEKVVSVEKPPKPASRLEGFEVSVQKGESKGKEGQATKATEKPSEEDHCLAILTHYQVNYRYITTQADAEEAVQALLIKTKILGLDIETTGLDPHQATIRLIQVYDGNGTVYVFDLARLSLSTLEPLWTKLFVAHNATFETKFLLKQGISPVLHCTKLMGRLATGRIRNLSLAHLVHEFLNWKLDKTLQASDWAASTLTDKQLSYAALDALLASKLAQKLNAKLSAMGQVAAYQPLQALIPIIAKQELCGCPFDVAAHTTLVRHWTDERNRLEKGIYKALGDDTINIDSGPQLGAWLEKQLPEDIISQWPKTALGKLKTDKDSLALYGELPIVKPLLQYKHLAKRLSTYGQEYADYINPTTQRLHPSYLIGGTRVGKFASSQPNMMQLPRDSGVRALIRAPEGRVIVCADFGQLELRIAAELSQDEALRQAYRDGEDVHLKTASAIAGVPMDQVTKAQRQAAKACNFGLLYGQGAKGLADYARASYGVEMTQAQAQQARDAFFHAYPGLRRWQLATDTQARQSLKVYSKMGRLRDFRLEGSDYKLTEALNTAVASSAADVLIASLTRLDSALAGIDAHLIAHVHDEILLEASEQGAEQAKVILTQAMVDGFLEVFPNASTVGLVEAKHGQTWAEAK